MADVTPKSEGRKGARKHSGLGRGLGALIPQAGEQKSPAAPVAPARPLDVFFPEGPSAKGRGGSAKDLLQPKRATASSMTRTSQSLTRLQHLVDQAILGGLRGGEDLVALDVAAHLLH